jgi:NADH-quinone oxidoreductase subunit N
VKAEVEAPKIHWESLSPLIALLAGGCIVLMLGLMRGRAVRTGFVPFLTIVTFGTAIGLSVWRWDAGARTILEGALRVDQLTLFITILVCIAGIAATLVSFREEAAEEAGHGEYHALLISSVLGMVVLAGAQNLVTLFLGFELLSIPLYVLCATELRRATSLESGLKYLIVGSVGSATLVYGLALVYGATGATDYDAIATAAGRDGIADDVLFLTGVALVLTGLAFKASVAPFHQWTPDVYEGAPTPITAFMAVATKAAAFGVLLRLFDVALVPAAETWAPAMAALAAVTIVVGNVGALGQSSLKRLLAYSSVAQAGYMLAGVVVTTKLGIQATAFYLAVYMLMNLAAFAVIVVRERETPLGDDIASLNGLGAERPWLAWPMTIAMLALAGLPATAGFFGKIYLIQAVVDNGYAWLGVVIVLGSAISLVYYLRVVAAMWIRPDSESAPAAVRTTPAGHPVMAGGAPESDSGADRGASEGERPGEDTAGAARPVAGADGSRAIVAFESEEDERPVVRNSRPFAVAVAVVCAAATVFFGIYPGPLFDVARETSQAFTNLL